MYAEDFLKDITLNRTTVYVPSLNLNVILFFRK